MKSDVSDRVFIHFTNEEHAARLEKAIKSWARGHVAREVRDKIIEAAKEVYMKEAAIHDAEWRENYQKKREADQKLLYDDYLKRFGKKFADEYLRKCNDPPESSEEPEPRHVRQARMKAERERAEKEKRGDS